MKARRRRHVEIEIDVVRPVAAPQQRHAVQQDVPPVERVVHERHGECALHPPWQMEPLRLQSARRARQDAFLAARNAHAVLLIKKEARECVRFAANARSYKTAHRRELAVDGQPMPQE